MTKPYIPNDIYSKKARDQNYRARSVFKLMELDKKFRLLKNGQKILDLAAAPGSWAQYASQKIGESGSILAVDLQKIEFISSNVTSEICDVTDFAQIQSIITRRNTGKFDLILSDIAPSTTGITDLDHGKSIELNTKIFDLSQIYLRPRGTLVMKVFEGKDFQKFVAKLKKYYANVIVTKVKATRDRSYEMYIICK